ncbi:sensor histidine kinase [Anaerosphaera multitolerans]|uniref:histidine kinase n=1 Tax=Anaerosphaera multitolerans TaxID=2487351 RepID=A0A437S8W9_9FIRM|nr:HAMP domain-containing sensor histidine kinase [Anaerosphaera multitolerans]RVU55462.1 sensor histidine kinase [Anaerosphaera multitolerans]
MEILVLFLVIIIIGLIGFIIKERIGIRKITDGMDSIFELKSASDVLNYDETMLSKLEVKALRFVKDNLDVKSKLEVEQEMIQSLIGDISHQTKTPISNISIYTELLAEKYDDEYIDILKFEIEKLSFLIESLVKASQLEANLIQLNFEEVNIKEMLENLIKKSKANLNEKSINIKYNTAFKTLNIDRKWTEEAVFNLIDNGIKYSKAESDIDIVVSDTTNYLKIDIVSTGDKIAEGEYNKLFQRFYRGRNAGSKQGVGIGLFLSRKIIELQGGYIIVNSREQNVFSVFLPL